MKIAIVGTGYVGLVSGTCFAEMGIDVTCVDVDANKIEGLLQGKIPIYEPGLDELVLRNTREGRLHFTTDLSQCIDDVEIVFSALGTPPDEDGSADLQYVLSVARTFGRHIKKYTILVTKSTVPVGTARKVSHRRRMGEARREYSFRCCLQSGVSQRRSRHKRLHVSRSGGGRSRKRTSTREDESPISSFPVE